MMRIIMLTSDDKYFLCRQLLDVERELGDGQYDGIYIAGGAVRDLALKKPVRDIDVVIVNPNVRLKNRIYKLSVPPKKEYEGADFEVRYKKGLTNMGFSVDLIVINQDIIPWMKSNFDYDFNQVAWNPEDDVVATEHFEDFYMDNNEEEKCIVRHMLNSTDEFTWKMWNRFIRLQEKYPNATFLDKNGKLIKDSANYEKSETTYKSFFYGDNVKLENGWGNIQNNVPQDDIADERVNQANLDRLRLHEAVRRFEAQVMQQNALNQVPQRANEW